MTLHSSYAQEAHPSHRQMPKAHLHLTLCSLRLHRTLSWLATCLPAQLSAMCTACIIDQLVTMPLPVLFRLLVTPT